MPHSSAVRDCRSRQASPRSLSLALVATLVALGLLAEGSASWADTATGEPTAETLLAQVERADERLNQAAEQRDRETFHGLLAEDTVFLAGELYRGRLAVAAIWQNLFVGKYDFRYQGETLETVVADSGEFAWSLGSVRTTFQRPGLPEPNVSEGYYLHLWIPGDADGGWQLLYNASLVVHPTLGEGRDPRSGLMTAWPELADQVGAEVTLSWSPEVVKRAASGEVAYTFGSYEASFLPLDDDAPVTESEKGTELLGEPEVVNEPGGEREETATEGVVSNDTSPQDDRTITGQGYYLAVWQKDAKGRWQLAGEGLTPPGIYGGN